MRHRDDDLSPFRDDAVFKALTGPATEAELAGEAEAVEAYRGAAPQPAPRRHAPRVAAAGTAALLVLAVSGGAAAAYTNSLPASWQQKLHNEIHSIPAPKHHANHSPVRPPVAAPQPTSAVTPTPAPTVGGVSPSATAAPTTSGTASASPTPSLPVVVTTGTASATPSPSPTTSGSSTPAATGELTISVSPGTRVPIGTRLTVNGRLKAPDGTAMANRSVVLAERIVGEPSWQRVGAAARTSASGDVSFAVPPVQRNVLLVLRSRHHMHSTVQQVVVVPTITVRVTDPVRDARSTTVTVTVTGGQSGDVVFIRRADARAGGQRATLDGSLTATFTVPVSQQRIVHYRAIVPPTNTHGGHELAFYTPASGASG